MDFVYRRFYFDGSALVWRLCFHRACFLFLLSEGVWAFYIYKYTVQVSKVKMSSTVGFLFALLNIRKFSIAGTLGTCQVARTSTGTALLFLYRVNIWILRYALYLRFVFLPAGGENTQYCIWWWRKLYATSNNIKCLYRACFLWLEPALSWWESYISYLNIL